MPGIQIIEYESVDQDNNPVARVCGLQVTENGSDMPHLHLFMLPFKPGSSEGDDLLDYNIANVCADILAKRFPKLRISQPAWQYTKGPYTSDIKFKEQHGFVTGIDFSNSLIMNRGFAKSFEAYEEALAAPSFGHAICKGGDSTLFKGPRASLMIVPVPEHPAKYLIIKPGPNNGTHKIVLADAESFMENWVHQAMRKNHAHTYADLQLKHADPFHYERTTEDSIHHIRAHRPYQAAQFGYAAVPPPNRLPKLLEKASDFVKKFSLAQQPIPTFGFEEGMHRTLDMYVLGAPFLPLEMRKGTETEKFEREFGWQGHRTPHQALQKTYDV
jgi:hypothetical protein